MKYIETNLPPIDTLPQMVADVADQDATAAVAMALIRGGIVIGGNLIIRYPYFKLTEIIDVAAETCTVTGDEDLVMKVRAAIESGQVRELKGND